MTAEKRQKMMVMGLPWFSIGLRHDEENERYLIDASFRPPSPFEWINAIHLFGKEPKQIEPAHALRFLIDNWRSIAGKFTVDGPSSCEVDLGGIFAVDPVRSVMRRRGYHVSFDQAPFLAHLGSHSVLVVECFMQLGRVLSAIVMDGWLSAQWDELMRNTMLLPFEPDDMLRDWEWERELKLASVDEATFYAAKLGLSVQNYRRWAVFSYARQLVWALDTDENEKPKGEEVIDSFFEDPRTLPPLPLYADISALAARAAELMTAKTPMAKSRADIVVDAIIDRNSMARQIVVYNEFYGKDGNQGIDARFTGAFEGEFDFKVEKRANGFYALVDGVGRGAAHSLPLILEPPTQLEIGTPYVAKGVVRFEDGVPVDFRISEISVDTVAVKIRKLFSDQSIEAMDGDDLDYEGVVA